MGHTKRGIDRSALSLVVEIKVDEPQAQSPYSGSTHRFLV
jgi:hypothetical protein